MNTDVVVYTRPGCPYCYRIATACAEGFGDGEYLSAKSISGTTR